VRDEPPTEPARAVADFLRPELNAVQQGALAALRRDGIAVLLFHELLGEKLLREALAEIDGFVRSAETQARAVGARPGRKGDLIIDRFGPIVDKMRPSPTLALDSVWIRIGTSELLLDIVNSYRERLLRLYYLDNWFTVPFPDADERVASQRWHRDPEDEHVVKVFLYLSDVDAGAGPFEYIRSSATGGRYGDLWPWGQAKRYPPPDGLTSRVAKEDRLTVTGPAGTLILCDTGGFHRGGFASMKPRVLATWTYVGPDARKTKPMYVIADPSLDQLAPQARFALA
jgi:hypothetical protein